MGEKIVLAFFGSGSNDAIRGMIQAYGDALAATGLPVVHVSSDAAELQYAAQQMASGSVAFGITWLGIGQDLAARIDGVSSPRNLWEAFEIPLIKFQGDLPAYFVDYHLDVPLTAANLYGPKEFLDFRNRWLPEAKTTAGIVPPLPLDPIPRAEIDIATRGNGKLIFLKNGNSPAELRELWRERLPKSVSTLIEGIAQAAAPVALRPGLFCVGDFVAKFLEAESISSETVLQLIPFFSAQLDDYLRRVKSTMIAEAILDFPVIIQGRFWAHLNTHGRRATVVGGQDFVESRKIYRNELGIIDMSPNVDTSPHERVLRAAGAYGLVITNRQGWLSENFRSEEDLTFEFSQESIKARVADVLSRPAKYLETAIGFGERFRERYTAEAFADCVIRMADLAALQWRREKPNIQPFFVWSSRRRAP